MTTAALYNVLPTSLGKQHQLTSNENWSFVVVIFLLILKDIGPLKKKKK